MKRSTLTLLAAALALSAGMLAPETASAKGRGYVSPSEADSNSIQAAHVRSTGRRVYTRGAQASGRDCGEAAQNEATNARYISAGASFIPFPGTIISGIASFASIGAGNESTTKWKRCVRQDVKTGIAGINKDMHAAVGKVEDNLRAEIVTIAQELHTEQQRYEQRIVSLELSLASVPMMLSPAHTNMPLCAACDLQVIPDLPTAETTPETPTADASKAGPVSPSSAQEMQENVVPPPPVRKKRQELLPGEQFAKTSAYTCLNGTCE